MALLDLNGVPATNPVLNDSDKSEYYNPSADEKKDIDLLFKALGEGKQFRSKYDKHWDKWERYYDGDQWEVKRAEGKSMPVVNVIRQTIQSMIPILTDAQPGFDINAKAPQDYEFADILSDIIHYWWTYRGMNMTLVDTITQCMFYHCGIQKVIWDDELENGLGDVRVDDLDPRDVWVTKDTVDFNKNCRWVIHRMCKPLGELRRLFPDKAEQIKATGEDKNKAEKQTNSYDGQIMVVSPIDKKEKNIPQQPGYGYDDSRVVEFYEMWLQDSTLIQIEQESKEHPGEMETVQQKRYPHGKIITVTNDRVLLQSAESPRKDGRFPFVRYVDMQRPGKFYGDGEIGQLYEPQKMLNKTVAVIFDCLNMMGNPTWICDTNSGVDPDLITNTIGQVIMKTTGSEVRRDEAPTIPAYIFQFYSEMQKMIDQVSGMHDITQGRKPMGVTAAKAIETLQEAAQTRIRLKERNLGGSLVQLGYLVVNTMMQYYVKPRVAKLAQKGQWPQFLEFYFKSPDETSYSMATKYHTFYENNRKYIAEQDWAETQPTKGIFDIEVQSGTSLPFQKENRANLAMSLFDKKAIDQESLLDTLQWKDKDKIMTRMAQVAAAAPPQPPPGA
jgi:hypothetical protein